MEARPHGRETGTGVVVLFVLALDGEEQGGDFRASESESSWWWGYLIVVRPGPGRPRTCCAWTDTGRIR
jgi:hypothetical protein